MGEKTAAYLRLLVTEANPANQKLITSMLTQLGYDFEIVSNAQEAKEALERQSFDVIFSEPIVLEKLEAQIEERSQNVVQDQVHEKLEQYSQIGGPEMVTQLIELFNSSVPDDLSTLKSELNQNHAEGVREAAHRLKSSFANLGFLRMQRICERIEKSAREGQLTGVKALIQQLHQNFETAQKGLARYNAA